MTASVRVAPTAAPYYSSTTPTVSKPVGTVAGDVLLFSFVTNDGYRVMTAMPTGWSLLASATTTDSPGAAFWLCAKVAGGSEPADYQFTFNYAFNGRIATAAYKDGSSVSVAGVAAMSAVLGASPYTVDASAITVPDNDSKLVWFGAGRVTTIGGTPAYASPSGFAEQLDHGSSGDWLSLSIADKTQASAGTSGAANGTLTHAGGGNTHTVGVLVAIAPAGGSTAITASGEDELPVITAVVLDESAITTTAGNTSDQVVTVKDQGGIGLPYLTGTPTSSNEAVATVAQLAATDANGQATVRITTLAAGTATISIAFDGVSDSLALTVVSAGQSERSISPSSVTLDPNETQQFVAYADGEQTAHIWTVPVGGGTITSAGLYTAPASVGTATVRASDPVDSAQYAEATVTIAVVEYGTASVTWASAANLTLDYFVFDKYDDLIASGSAAFDSTGSADLRVPVEYIGDPVLVAVNNLDFDMATAGKVHGQKVVTVV